MRLNIPCSGSLFTLTRAWSFRLFNVHPNHAMRQFMGLKFDKKASERWKTRTEYETAIASQIVTLPTGSVVQLLECGVSDHPRYPDYVIWKLLKYPTYESRAGIRRPKFCVLAKDCQSLIVRETTR